MIDIGAAVREGGELRPDLIHIAEVSCIIPSVREYIRGRLGILVIALHYNRSLEEDLALIRNLYLSIDNYRTDTSVLLEMISVNGNTG